MPYPADIMYPAKATNAAWQKKKSTIDKAGKTGVGPALTAAQVAWGTIPFKDLDDSKNKPTSSKRAKESWDKAKAAWALVVAARRELGKTIGVVKTQSASRKLTDASRQALKAILADLEAADKRLEQMDDLPGMFEIDHRNKVKEEDDKAQAREEAKSELHDVELKKGTNVVAEGARAKLQNDGSYVVEVREWSKSVRHGIDILQEQLTLEGTDKLGHPFSKSMKLISVKGTASATLK
jgi:hypothetical protein